jgi:large subunit ribosomal protein L29
MKKKQSLRELSISDLKDRLEQDRLQLVKMRLNHAVSPIENPHSITDTRKDIARVLTELRRREIEESNK